jgi:hypothetical protein
MTGEGATKHKRSNHKTHHADDALHAVSSNAAIHTAASSCAVSSPCAAGLLRRDAPFHEQQPSSSWTAREREVIQDPVKTRMRPIGFWMCVLCTSRMTTCVQGACAVSSRNRKLAMTSGWIHHSSFRIHQCHLALIRSICSSVYPISPSTLRVCSPSVGGGLWICAGVFEKRTGIEVVTIGPACACL